MVTDLNDHIPLITKTLEQNSHLLQLVHGNTIEQPVVGGKVKTMVLQHEWGQVDPNNILGQIKFDFIFGTDIAYRHYLHGALIESLKQLSHPRTIILIGITMMDTDVIFFQRLVDAGFIYDRLGDHLMDPEFRGGSFGLFLVRFKPQHSF